MPGAEYHYAESSCIELILTSHAAREYPWHTHTSHRTLGLVCAGTVMFATRSEQCVLAEGSSFFIPPNVAHFLHITPETVLAVLCLDCSKDIGENLDDLIDSMLHSDQKPSLLNELSVSDLLKLKELAAGLAEREFQISTYSDVTAPVQAAARLLQEKPEETFSLEYLSSVAGYSQWHFLRLFQKETGMTPHVYQLVCRLRMLRSLLRTGTAAAEAAVSAGFTDQSHMTKVFKLHHGLTPRQFLKASFMLED